MTGEGYEELPDVVGSAVDPDVECVRAAGAAKPPDGEADAGGGPCPPGYLPRRRRRGYDTGGPEGKDVVTGRPAGHREERRPD